MTRRTDLLSGGTAQRLPFSSDGPAPAFVVSIDLVKHSTRDAADIAAIQLVMEGVLKTCVEAVVGDESVINYTGDGYICLLPNRASARGVEFLRSLLPSLRRALKPHGQEVRIGADFGFAALATNALTQKLEHFAAPGIRAARLQAACEPGEVLVSSTVRDIFMPTAGSGCFSANAKTIKVKAHEIIAYQFLTDELASVHRAILSDLMLRPRVPHGEELFDKDYAVLIVEDDDTIRELLARILRRAGLTVVTAEDGARALKHTAQTPFDLIITDLMMPGIDGWQFINQVRAGSAEQPILIYSAAPRSEANFSGVPHLEKPFPVMALFGAVYVMLHRPRWVELLRWFPDAAAILPDLVLCSEMIRTFFLQHASADAVDGLLRHKAKEYVHAWTEALRVGERGAPPTTLLSARLARLVQLGNRAKRAEALGLSAYLDALVTDVRADHPQLTVTARVAKDVELLVSGSIAASTVLCAAELIGNACDAVVGPATVEVDLSVRASDDTVRLIVRNSGPKISSRLATRIFDEGVTSKGEGRGLGLSLIKRLTESLSGNVQLDQRGGVAFIGFLSKICGLCSARVNCQVCDTARLPLLGRFENRTLFSW